MHNNGLMWHAFRLMWNTFGLMWNDLPGNVERYSPNVDNFRLMWNEKRGNVVRPHCPHWTMWTMWTWTILWCFTGVKHLSTCDL